MSGETSQSVRLKDEKVDEKFSVKVQNFYENLEAKVMRFNLMSSLFERYS